MLKHLLSSGTNADQLDPPQQYNAYPIEYKYEVGVLNISLRRLCRENSILRKEIERQPNESWHLISTDKSDFG